MNPANLNNMNISLKKIQTTQSSVIFLNNEPEIEKL
jgi:hypothetical protein